MSAPADIPSVQGRAPGSRLDPSSFSRHRPLFWLTLAFVLGIALDDGLQPGRQAIAGFCAAVLLLLLIGWTAWPKGKREGWVLFVTASLAGVAGGVVRHAVDARFLSPLDLASRTPPTPCLSWVEGTINEVRRSADDPGRAWWTIDVEALGATEQELAPASGRVQLGVELSGEPASAAEGDRVRFLACLEAPASASLPVGFDAANYLARQGIRRVGSSTGTRLAVVGSAPWWRLDLWLGRMSNRLAERNERAWGAEAAALPNALLLGRRDGIEWSDRQAFQRAGTAHLLSISGLHLQMLAVAAWWLLGFLGWSRRRAGLAVMLFSIGYAALAGAQAPLVRSAVMIVLYLGAQWFYRAPDPLTVLAGSAMAILFFQPETLFTASFQLTFLAVLALVTIYPSLEAAWRSWRAFPEEWVVDQEEHLKVRALRYARQSIFVSVAAWIGTSPAVAWHMGYFCLSAVLVNLVAVPLTALAMLGGLVAMIGGGWIGSVGLGFSTLLLGLNRWASGFEWAAFSVSPPSLWLLAAYLAVCVWVWVGRGGSATWPRLALMLPAAVLALATAGLFHEATPTCRVTVLDVARGRAASVETPGGDAVLVDCGGAGSGRALAEYLRREGHASLALLVISEDSPDALGGAVELLERMPVRRAILPRAAAPGSALRALMDELARRETPFDWVPATGVWLGPGDLRWEFFSDVAEPNDLPRAGSEALCVAVRMPGLSMAFVPLRSGSSARRLLANAGERLRCDILRLYGGANGRWPEEAETFIRRSGARTLVAGVGASLPEEGVGVDLTALALSRGLRLLAPRREGSLRFGEGGEARVLAWRQGAWVKLGP